MGRALCDAFPAARAVLDEVDDALGEPLSALIFEGPLDRLTLTANAQPALMATSIAAVRALETVLGRRLPELVGFVAGRSASTPRSPPPALSGSPTRHACFGCVGPPCRRRLPGAGAMAAILGADLPTVEAVLRPRPKAACAMLTTMARDSGDLRRPCRRRGAMPAPPRQEEQRAISMCRSPPRSCCAGCLPCRRAFGRGDRPEAAVRPAGRARDRQRDRLARG